jgi:tRNA(Ile)-lysidine synthase TilS/MesJ
MKPPTATRSRKGEAVLARIVGKLKKAERSFALALRGQRILVALSGGWDSLALLLALEGYRKAVELQPSPL